MARGVSLSMGLPFCLLLIQLMFMLEQPITYYSATALTFTAPPVPLGCSNDVCDAYVTLNSAPTPERGAPGATLDQVVLCPAGTVATGALLWLTLIVFQQQQMIPIAFPGATALKCRNIIFPPGDAGVPVLGSLNYTTNFTAGSEKSNFVDFDCPIGSVLIGYGGEEYTGGLYDRFICGQLGVVSNTSSSVSFTRRDNVETSTSGVRKIWGGGTAFADLCPGNAVVTGFNGYTEFLANTPLSGDVDVLRGGQVQCGNPSILGVVQDDCLIHNCQNGGVCMDGVFSYACICPSPTPAGFFTGQFCETFVVNEEEDSLLTGAFIGAGGALVVLGTFVFVVRRYLSGDSGGKQSSRRRRRGSGDSDSSLDSFASISTTSSSSSDCSQYSNSSDGTASESSASSLSYSSSISSISTVDTDSEASSHATSLNSYETNSSVASDDGSSQ